MKFGPEEVEKEVVKASRLDKRALLYPVVLVLLIGIAVGGYIVWNQTTNQGPVPKSIKTQAKFPVYAPQKLPYGYSLNQSSFNYTSGVVSYTVEAPGNRKLLVSQQAVPAGFDFNSFKKALLNEKDFNVGSDIGVSGTRLFSTIVSVVHGDTWILMSGPQEISVQDGQEIAQSLVK